MGRIVTVGSLPVRVPAGRGREVAMAPRAEPLRLPTGYGTPSTTLDWAAVRSRLASARPYWVVTCPAHGRPHAVPVDGPWLGGGLEHGRGGEPVDLPAPRAPPQGAGGPAGAPRQEKVA